MSRVIELALNGARVLTLHQGAVPERFICKAAWLRDKDKVLDASPESIPTAATCEGFTSDSWAPAQALRQRCPWASLHGEEISAPLPLALWCLSENSTPPSWDWQMEGQMIKVVFLILVSRWGHCCAEIKWWRPHHGSMTAVPGSQPVLSSFKNIAPKRWAIKQSRATLLKITPQINTALFASDILYDVTSIMRLLFFFSLFLASQECGYRDWLFF